MFMILLEKMSSNKRKKLEQQYYRVLRGYEKMVKEIQVLSYYLNEPFLFNNKNDVPDKKVLSIDDKLSNKDIEFNIKTLKIYKDYIRDRYNRSRKYNYTNFCFTCDGRGLLAKKECMACHGFGKMKAYKKYLLTES